MNGVFGRIALLLLLCVSGMSPVSLTQESASKSAQRPSPTDVYEAVLRYQVETWELVADSYCVHVDGKDTETALLDRFKPLRVKPASACRKQTTRRVAMRVVDKTSGKMSVIFDIGQIRWIKPSQVEVDGGYLWGSECMAEGTYHVEWDGKRWIVIKFDVLVQS